MPTPTQIMTPSPAEELLKPREAAALLRVSLDVLYELARDGVVPSYRLGKMRLRFRASELRDALKPREPKPRLRGPKPAPSAPAEPAPVAPRT
jgi:excisionase family DNA binding protein